MAIVSGSWAQWIEEPSDLAQWVKESEYSEGNTVRKRISWLLKSKASRYWGTEGLSILSWRLPRGEWSRKGTAISQALRIWSSWLWGAQAGLLSIYSWGSELPNRGCLSVRNRSQIHTSTHRWEKQIVFSSCFPSFPPLFSLLLLEPNFVIDRGFNQFAELASNNFPHTSPPDTHDMLPHPDVLPKSHLNSLQLSWAFWDVALQPLHIFSLSRKLFFPFSSLLL